jgi:hypothetical protein
MRSCRLHHYLPLPVVVIDPIQYYHSSLVEEGIDTVSKHHGRIGDLADEESNP